MKFTLKAAAIAAGLVVSATAYSADLTFVSFGGAYGGAQEEFFLKPYMKDTGKKVLMADYSGGVAELKAQVESGNVTWDIVDMEYIDVDRACDEGLLEPLDPTFLEKGDNGALPKDDFYAGTLHECAIGNIIWSTVYAYNKSTVTGDKKPKTIKNLFDLKKYPGKRALRKRPQVNLEWALLADGVSAADVYKVLATKAGQERAFKKLDSIKKDVVWFDSWSQAPQLLNDGGAVFVQSANGRFFSAIREESKPFVIVWDGQAYDFDGFAIPKGSKNIKESKEMIRYMATSKRLASMEKVAYGSTRKSSMPYISKDVIEHLPSTHIKEGFKVVGSFWADNGAVLTEQFNAWLLK